MKQVIVLLCAFLLVSCFDDDSELISDRYACRIIDTNAPNELDRQKDSTQCWSTGQSFKDSAESVCEGRVRSYLSSRYGAYGISATYSTTMLQCL